MKSKVKPSNYKYQRDYTLDNKRVPVSLDLIEFSYKAGDNKISERKVHFNRMSGFCFDPEKSTNSSVNIEDVNKLDLTFGYLNGNTPHWRIWCYEQEKTLALDKLTKHLTDYKNKLLKSANSVPV